MHSPPPPKKNPSSFFSFVESDKLVLNFIWKCKGPRMIKTLPKLVPQCERIWLTKYKDYCTMWYGLRDAPTEQKREPRNGLVLIGTLEMGCRVEEKGQTFQ